MIKVITRNSLCGLILTTALVLYSAAGRCEIVTTVQYSGVKYYVDVIKASGGDNVNFEIWFRTSDNASSVDDKKIMALTFSKSTFNDYVNAACRTKDFVDGGKTMIGCIGLVGSAFCAVSTVADPTMAIVCTSTWEYTVETGAADCMKGTVGALAAYFHKPEVGMVIQNAIGLIDPKFSEAVGNAVDYLCEDIKKSQGSGN